MAINRRADLTTDQQLTLDITNGDLTALQTIKDRFNLNDEEAVLRFALAVMSQASNDTIYIEDDTGTKVGLHPSQSLRRDNQNDHPANQ